MIFQLFSDTFHFDHLQVFKCTLAKYVYLYLYLDKGVSQTGNIQGSVTGDTPKVFTSAMEAFFKNIPLEE